MQRHAYQTAPGTTCADLNASFSDEPPTLQSAQVRSYAAGSSRFEFALQAAAAPLRLRRIFDALLPGQAAEVWVNGTLSGYFPYTQANPARRWQQQEVVLNTPVGGTDFQFEIRPRFANPDGAIMFTESAYELWGGFIDPIFVDGFNGSP